VNLWTVFRFVFGNAGAIREVARDRAALCMGIALVLLTGIARNYDQTSFTESPFWLIGPLGFSLCSGSFLYLVLVWRFARRHFPEEERREPQWATFMALFWMTAPVAWLYAIPVERFLDSYRAAEANIALLGIVSLWRVLLMSRVLSVLFEIHFVRALAWVLLAASFEVIVVVALGLLSGESLGEHILAAMSGMRNSPEVILISNALGGVWEWSWGVLVVCLLGLLARRFRGTIQPLPRLLPGKVPWVQLAIVAGIWVVIAIGPQKEQQHFVTHAALIGKKAYPEALAYLGQYQASDFPPGRRLEPNPYQYRVWEDLPPTVALLKPNTAPWIRHVYLNHASRMLSHYYPQYDSLTNLDAMLSAIEKLPEGREWLGTNENDLARQGLRLGNRGSEPPESTELMAKSNILGTLSRMGIGKTNLERMKE
jgi:hypothetical protein